MTKIKTTRLSGSGYKYLGHFRNPSVVKAGHNNSDEPDFVKNARKAIERNKNLFAKKRTQIIAKKERYKRSVESEKRKKAGLVPPQHNKGRTSDI